MFIKVNLGRAARTDAGVHAAGNVVSLKMITDVPGIDDIVARINEELPPEIRLWGYVRHSDLILSAQLKAPLGSSPKLIQCSDVRCSTSQRWKYRFTGSMFLGLATAENTPTSSLLTF
jgi:hypothetical protein